MNPADWQNRTALLLETRRSAGLKRLMCCASDSEESEGSPPNSSPGPRSAK